MGLKLISASPSPYARKVRITLQEKGIPFELITEVPWDSTTATPQHNPLEKIPILILEDGEAVYESSYILQYIDMKMGRESMFGKGVDERLRAMKAEVVVDGVCDALVLLFFEKQREVQSEAWKARQMRKVDGGVKALADMVGHGEAWVIGGKFGHTEICIGSLFGWLSLRFAEYPWRERHPGLARYVDRLEERQSFRDTVPKAQNIQDKIV